MRFNRVAGSILVVSAILGFLTIADDLRHVGEFVGVSSILLAGLVLLAGSFNHRILLILPVRSMAVGIFMGMILGAVLDNMILGVGIGLTLGTGVGRTLIKIPRSNNGNAP